MYASDVLHYYGPDSMIIYIYIYMLTHALCYPASSYAYTYMYMLTYALYNHVSGFMYMCVYIYIYMRMFYFGDPPRLVLELLSVHCHDYSCVSFAHVNLFA